MIGRRAHDEAQSFDAAFHGRIPNDEHIADLVRFAEELCAVAAVEPTPAFRGALRARLMTEAATVLVPLRATVLRDATNDAPAHRVRPARRHLVAVTTGLVASAGAVGLVASSASAIPGDTLYSVKRGVESVELQLHRDDAARGAYQLSQASERLAEARRLSDDGASEALIARSLEDFSSSATSGSTRLFTAYTSTGDEQPIAQVNEFAANSSLDLRALAPQLPDGLTDTFEAARAAVTDLASEATSLCASCDPVDIGALVGPVNAVVEQTPAAPTAAPDVAPSTRPSVAPKPDRTPRTATPTPTPTSRPTVPAATAATPPPAAKTPSLNDVTDPLIGGLLGDGDQGGLVPGLLKGLLGERAQPKALPRSTSSL